LIKTSYSPSAGTAFITFTNVKVPIENLLGVENMGFEIIMSNFNHERWVIVVCLTTTLRLMVEQCFRWANLREAFGKNLISQPVIRNKLAHMVAQVESLDSWVENVTFQMTKMTEKQQFKYLGGTIALLKLQTTRTATFISDQACQIFGGRAITRTGMGMYIERFQKSFKFASIYGGSEEIMADLGIK
jgi:alkylation response protein AidB-like acyl-CoA dehydrogenase